MRALESVVDEVGEDHKDDEDDRRDPRQRLVRRKAAVTCQATSQSMTTPSKESIMEMESKGVVLPAGLLADPKEHCTIQNNEVDLLALVDELYLAEYEHDDLLRSITINNVRRAMAQHLGLGNEPLDRKRKKLVKGRLMYLISREVVPSAQLVIFHHSSSQPEQSDPPLSVMWPGPSTTGVVVEMADKEKRATNKKIMTEVLQNIPQFKAVLGVPRAFGPEHWKVILSQMENGGDYTNQLFFCQSRVSQKWRSETLVKARAKLGIGIIWPNVGGRALGETAAISARSAIEVAKRVTSAHTLHISDDVAANDVAVGQVVSTLEAFRGGVTPIIHPP